MSNTNLILLIVVLILVFGGGGFYWRGRRVHRLRAISVFRPSQRSASTLSRSSGSGQRSSGTTRVSCMGAGRIG